MSRRFHRLLLLTAISLGLLCIWTGPVAAQEPALSVTIHDVPFRMTDPTFSVEIELECYNCPAALTIGMVNLCLVYDAGILSFGGISDSGFIAEHDWFLGFIQEPATIDGQARMAIELTTKDQDSLAGGIEMDRLSLSLQFSVRDEVAPDNLPTSIDFCWRTCPDNTIWSADYDTLYMAGEVLDSDSDLITDNDLSMPGVTGPEERCFDPAYHGGATTAPSISFRSGLIGRRETTDVSDLFDHEDEQLLPVRLFQNFPNPLNPETKILFSLSQPSSWALQVFNLQGQVVRTYQGVNGPGSVSVTWDGCDQRGRSVASGVYFYRLSAGSTHSCRKMVLVK